MEFIEHTVAWCRGEIFEGRLLALFGAVVVTLGLLFWRFGSTPGAKAMFDEVRSNWPRVPNLYRMLGHSPNMLRGWPDLHWIYTDAAGVAAASPAVLPDSTEKPMAVALKYLAAATIDLL